MLCKFIEILFWFIDVFFLICFRLSNFVQAWLFDFVFWFFPCLCQIVRSRSMFIHRLCSLVFLILFPMFLCLVFSSLIAVVLHCCGCIMMVWVSCVDL